MAHRASIVLGAALVAVALLVPAPAIAGEARSGRSGVEFRAAPGEQNQVAVKRTSSRSVRITDQGAPVTPRGGCERVSANVVRCNARTAVDQPGGTVFLGDGDDSARSSGQRTFIALSGGDGNDVLTLGAATRGDALGAAGDDVLIGSGATNSLSGGDGTDRLAGYGGDDNLNGGAGTDSFDGGDGVDVVDYSAFDLPAPPDRDVPVRATFDGQPNDGRPGENENLGGEIEGVRGGTRQDELRGDERDNVLLLGFFGPRDVPGGTAAGADGDDRIVGAEGFDLLDGGLGDDTMADGDLNGQESNLNAGDGDDRVSVYDIAEEDGATDELELAPTADQVVCGDGHDHLLVDTADPRPADCEIVTFQEFDQAITTGTSLDDRIVGQSGEGGRDVMRGLAGNDLLYGRGKRDRLIGGLGSDFLSGGTGRDIIESRGGGIDTVRCGKGRDLVMADRRDRVARSCEQVGRG